MKKGFFGGTFDPIHLGHLNLAIEMVERHQLDRILFCPAGCSPEKDGCPSGASAAHRLAMVSLAIAAVPAFSALEIEVHRPGLSYTVDSVQELQRLYPKDQFHLILGEDLLAGLKEWKQIEMLLTLAPPLVGTRTQLFPGKEGLPTKLLKKVESGLTLIPQMDISSREVRHRLKERKYCGHLLPTKVLDYIEQNHLYL